MWMWNLAMLSETSCWTLALPLIPVLGRSCWSELLTNCVRLWSHLSLPGRDISTSQAIHDLAGKAHRVPLLLKCWLYQYFQYFLNITTRGQGRSIGTLVQHQAHDWKVTHLLSELSGRTIFSSTFNFCDDSYLLSIPSHCYQSITQKTMIILKKCWWQSKRKCAYTLDAKKSEWVDCAVWE